MPTIYIDNKPYEVREGVNLLAACLSLGFDLPYFCWHPAMHSVGACRQCAVKVFEDENDKKGRIVMSCMTLAADGTRLSVDDAEAVAFRANVIEWLMLNHPHDCPICDEGGECHLQDMTVMTGHVYRRTRFKKRTHRDQYLGPFINHEMNRCIQCYRCVRFYRDYAGGRDFEVQGWHDDVYFGRSAEGVLESEFSGNLVEVCPTGVFTDKTLKRHYTRKWDLQTAPSVCVHCGLGCNTLPGERYGTLRRILNRYNGQVNGYFLCDRGRFGYEFANHASRVRRPMVRDAGGTLRPASKAEAMERVREALTGGNAIGIGSPRASLESNYALRRLVGAERFYSGESAADAEMMALAAAILRDGPARSPSLAEAAQADCVLILGEDLTNTAPMLALAMRQAVLRMPIDAARRLHIFDWDDATIREAIQQDKGPLFIATPAATKLDDIASAVFRAAPDDIARFGQEIAHALDPAAPARKDMTQAQHELVHAIAERLLESKRPLVISGPSCGSPAVMRAAANIAWALSKRRARAELCLTAPECNSMGLALMGKWGREKWGLASFPSFGKDAYPHFSGAPEEGGQTPFSNDEKGVSPLSSHGRVDTVIILENDLYRRAPAAEVGELLSKAKHVIVLDHIMTPTAERAEVVLPAATFAEASGTLVNNEGRAQRFYRAFPPEGDIQESWRWLSAFMGGAAAPPTSRDSNGAVNSKCLAAGPWPVLDDIAHDMAAGLPVFAPVLEIASPADFRMAGQKVARQPHRYSGRTAMTANLDVHEPQPPADGDSPLAFTMEGTDLQPPSPLVPRYWAGGWNSVQALNKFQEEVAGPMRGGDAGKRLIEPLSSQGLHDEAAMSAEGGHAPPCLEQRSAGGTPTGRAAETATPRAGRMPTPRQSSPRSSYFTERPEPFLPREGQLLFVPAWHIYGSEELSSMAEGVAELVRKPYVRISTADAEGMKLAEGAQAEVSIGAMRLTLPAVVDESLPRGAAMLPASLPGMPYLPLPAWGVAKACGTANSGGMAAEDAGETPTGHAGRRPTPRGGTP